MTARLVIAGNLIVDDIVYEDGSTKLGQAGGAALYAALGANLWGVSVGIASVVGEDYPREILSALRGKGIDLGGVRSVRGPSLRIWLLYEGRRRQVVHRLESPSHTTMSPVLADLPDAWEGDAYHLAPMPLEVQSEWIEGLRQRRPHGRRISLDLFELVDEHSVAPIAAVLRGVDLAFSSEDEILLASALDNPKDCLERLATAGGDGPSRLRHLVLKRGAKGGLAFEREGAIFRSWTAHSRAVLDPTGAGDAFAGGVLAGLLREGSIEEALEHGIVSASFAMEAAGAEGLLRASASDCAERARKWFGWDAA